MQTKTKYKIFTMAFVVPTLFLCFSQFFITIGSDVRIIEGYISSEGQFPYAVSFYYDTLEGRYFCTGSLINNKWILTAAHCLGGTQFTVYLGTNNIQQISSDAVVLNGTVAVSYPTFNSSTLEDDIGLVLLPTSVAFSDRIKAVELPTKSLGVNEDTIALGWGVTAGDQIFPSNVLRHVPLTTISNAVCRRTYGDFIKETMICLTGAGSQGICDGDSGGPLVQITPEGKHIQVGVTSFYSRYGCETSHPSGFTRTFEYLDWIRNITSQAESAAATTISLLSITYAFLIASAVYLSNCY